MHWDFWGTLLKLLTSLNWEYPSPSVLRSPTSNRRTHWERKSSPALPEYIWTKEGMRELLCLCYHEQGDWVLQHSGQSKFSFWRIWHNGGHCDLTINLKYPGGGTAMQSRKDRIECHFNCRCQMTFVWHAIHTHLTLPKHCTSPQVTPHYSSTGTTEFSLFSEGIAR